MEVDLLLHNNIPNTLDHYLIRKFSYMIKNLIMFRPHHCSLFIIRDCVLPGITYSAGSASGEAPKVHGSLRIGESFGASRKREELRQEDETTWSS